MNVGDLMVAVSAVGFSKGEIVIVNDIGGQKPCPIRISNNPLKNGIWCNPEDLRKASAEEVVQWKNINREIIEQEIQLHKDAIKVLTNKLAQLSNAQ